MTDGILYEKDLYKKLKLDAEDIIFSCGCQMGNIIWLFGKKNIVKYNLLTGEYERQKNNEAEVTIDAAYHDENIYFINDWRKVYRRNIINETTELLIDEDNNKPDDCKIRLIPTQKNIWVLPSLSEEIFIIDYSFINFKW